MGIRRGAKLAFAALEIGIKNQIFLEKPEVGLLIVIDWFDSCNGSLFTGMKHTAQESGSQL